MSVIETIADHLRDGGIDRVYVLGSVPKKPDYPYAVVSHGPGAPNVRPLAGPGAPAGRFVVHHFGRTHDAVEALAGLTFAAFDGVALTLTGTPVAWQEVASAVYRDADDDGVLSVVHTYRY